LVRHHSQSGTFDFGEGARGLEVTVIEVIGLSEIAIFTPGGIYRLGLIVA